MGCTSSNNIPEPKISDDEILPKLITAPNQSKTNSISESSYFQKRNSYRETSEYMRQKYNDAEVEFFKKITYGIHIHARCFKCHSYSKYSTNKYYNGYLLLDTFLL